jgi:hypothetical protein
MPVSLHGLTEGNVVEYKAQAECKGKGHASLVLVPAEIGYVGRKHNHCTAEVYLERIVAQTRVVILLGKGADSQPRVAAIKVQGDTLEFGATLEVADDITDRECNFAEGYDVAAPVLPECPKLERC